MKTVGAEAPVVELALGVVGTFLGFTKQGTELADIDLGFAAHGSDGPGDHLPVGAQFDVGKIYGQRALLQPGDEHGAFTRKTVATGGGNGPDGHARYRKLTAFGHFLGRVRRTVDAFTNGGVVGTFGDDRIVFFSVVIIVAAARCEVARGSRRRAVAIFRVAAHATYVRWPGGGEVTRHPLTLAAATDGRDDVLVFSVGFKAIQQQTGDGRRDLVPARKKSRQGLVADKHPVTADGIDGG